MEGIGNISYCNYASQEQKKKVQTLMNSGSSNGGFTIPLLPWKGHKVLITLEYMLITSLTNNNLVYHFQTLLSKGYQSN